MGGSGRVLLDRDIWDSDTDSRSSLRGDKDSAGDSGIDEGLGRNNYGFEGDVGDEEARAVTVEVLGAGSFRTTQTLSNTNRSSVGSAKASIVSVGKDDKRITSTATTTLGDTLVDAGNSNTNISDSSRLNSTDLGGAALVSYPPRNGSLTSSRKRIRASGHDALSSSARPQSYSAIEHFNASNKLILSGGRGLRASYAGETTCRDWGVSPILRREPLAPDGSRLPRGIVVNWVDC